MHTATSQPVGPAAVPAVARRLLASPNPQQQRVGHDLTRLLGLTARGGLWAGRCRPVALQALEDGGLGVILEMAVAGMIWDGQQPQRHDGGFTLALSCRRSTRTQSRTCGSSRRSPSTRT